MGEEAPVADFASLTKLILEMKNEQAEMKQNMNRIMRKEEEKESGAAGEPSKKDEEQFEVNMAESEQMESTFKKSDPEEDPETGKPKKIVIDNL